MTTNQEYIPYVPKAVRDEKFICQGFRKKYCTKPMRNLSLRPLSLSIETSR